MKYIEMQSFCEGNCNKIYTFLGAVLQTEEVNGCKEEGVRFSVWAPNAAEVHVVGDFNGWNKYIHIMELLEDYGIWTIFVPGVKNLDEYKYHIKTKRDKWLRKTDPCGKLLVTRGRTINSLVFESNFVWEDEGWMAKRYKRVKEVFKAPLFAEEPMNILKISSLEDGENYSKIADDLVPYLKELNYNFVELSLCKGYSLVSSMGTPDDLKYLINKMHLSNIGVIINWNPSMFEKSIYGLYRFDGTYLYESDDKDKRINEDLQKIFYNHERKEVQSFLLSLVFYFIEELHADGIVTDSVSNMLYYNSGSSKVCVRNEYGGFEYIPGIDFLKKLNRDIKKSKNGAFVIAEQSCVWDNTTKADYLGGLGFDYKLNVRFSENTLKYKSIKADMGARGRNHNLLRESLECSWGESYLLPIDTHISRNNMNSENGGYADKRAFIGYAIGHPGKKLSFLSEDIDYGEEKYYNKKEHYNRKSVTKKLKEIIRDKEFFRYIRDLNCIYMKESALWKLDRYVEGFRWIDGNNAGQSVVSFVRYSSEKNDFLVVICNFSDVSYMGYKVGVPRFSDYEEVVNSDAAAYGGDGNVNCGNIVPHIDAWNGQPCHVEIKLPANSFLILKPKLI